MSFKTDVYHEYKELVASGVMAGRLGVMAGGLSQRILSDYLWECQFIKMHRVSNEAAKDAVKMFLITAYDATRISFFQKQGASRNEFYARFYSRYL